MNDYDPKGNFDPVTLPGVLVEKYQLEEEIAECTVPFLCMEAEFDHASIIRAVSSLIFNENNGITERNVSTYQTSIFSKLKMSVLNWHETLSELIDESTLCDDKREEIERRIGTLVSIRDSSLNEYLEQKGHDVNDEDVHVAPDKNWKVRITNYIRGLTRMAREWLGETTLGKIVNVSLTVSGWAVMRFIWKLASKTGFVAVKAWVVTNPWCAVGAFLLFLYSANSTWNMTESLWDRFSNWFENKWQEFRASWGKFNPETGDIYPV